MFTVNVPSTVTRCPCRRRALRMEITLGFGRPVLGLGVGVGPPRGVGDEVGAGVVVMTTSSRSRSHRR